MPDELSEVMAWYHRHCDGEWEHGYGVTIENIDNPGWMVKIALFGTNRADTPFPPVTFNLDAQELQDRDATWWDVRVEDREYLAYCGARDLATVLRLFLDWANTDNP